MECASKREINKIIREITLNKQKPIKPRKRLRSVCLHLTRSVSTILKVKNFINRPGPWPLRAIPGRNCDPLARLITCQK